MFVSDVVQESFKTWKKGDVVIINAQTGLGKTYFILNQLLPYIASQGKRLLYLSNRTALKGQVELSYSSEFLANIKIENYQSFELAELYSCNLTEYGKDILGCEYWVMDEAHYFLADGFFNSDVLKCLCNVRNAQKSHVLIFMTATPKYLFLALGSVNFFSSLKLDFMIPSAMGTYSKLLEQLSSPTNLLKYKESDDWTYQNYRNYIEVRENYDAAYYKWEWEEQLHYYRQYQNSIPKCKFQEKFQKYSDYFAKIFDKVKYYQTSKGYDYVRPIYFKNLIQLCERIKNTPEQEKWLIFISSKRKGEDIKNNLESANVDSVIITAETKHHKKGLGGIISKEYEVYKSIIREAKSPVRVTIATSVLDNGVNLKDPALKHLAILEMNPTTFLQMLGRKRLEFFEEQINLYLQSKDIGEIKAYFERAILQYVRFLTKLQNVNYKADGEVWLNNDQVVASLRRFQGEYMVNGNFRPPFSNYVTEKTFTSVEQGKDFIGGPYLCRFFKPNPIAEARLMYDYYRMLALLEAYENVSEEEKKLKKETLWIEHQLSWLGLEYNPTCWIDYEQHIKAKKELTHLLETNEGNALSIEAQQKLKDLIIIIGKTSHPPMDTKIGRASLSKVKDALSELGFSQQISAKNCSIKGKQRNYWFVVRNKEQK